MRTLKLTAAWAAPFVALLAAAPQESQAPVAPVPQAPQVASDPAGLGAPPASNPRDDFHPGLLGSVQVLPLTAADLDDSVPLPVRPQAQPGAAGDQLAAPASGDPYFLGFAAGKHFPPAAESIDPRLVAAALPHYADGRPSQETYAFVMFRRRITPERVAELEGLGARVLGFHPHYSLKVALPPLSIDALAAHPAVRWVGVAQPWQKLHPRMDAALRGADGRIGVHINLFEPDSAGAPSLSPTGSLVEGVGPIAQDVAAGAPALPAIALSNGWQQRALEALGVEVQEYDASIASFRARIAPGALAQLVALDFVQFLEPQVEARLLHEESMPLVHADRQRAFYNGGTTTSVVAGIVDSGLQLDHPGLDSFAWVLFNHTSSPGTSDGCGHGSHVAGTMLGDGSVRASYKGGAEGLGWGSTGRFFNVKKFTSSCGDGGASVTTLLNSLQNGYTDSGNNFTRRPHVVNHSWGSIAVGGWLGSEADPRSLDTNVYNFRQLHVFSAGNDGPNPDTLTLHASTKNVLTVGNVLIHEGTEGDPGVIRSSSSRGPTGDNRWKPNLSAPGTSIYSVDSATTNGYTNKSGTSMAAPHVTAIAAQMMDRYAFMQDEPAMLSAALMASALTHGDVALAAPTSTHLDSYGTGRIDAYRASGGNSQSEMYFWAYNQASAGFGQFDVTVGANATRLTVVMTYHEPAASSGASQALVNDLDLWVDAAPFTAGGNTGEYFAHQSALDNTEIRMINNPPAGGFRFKVFPQGVTSTCKVGLCVIVSYGDTTPDGALVVSTSTPYVQPGELATITATASNPDHIATAVFLDATAAGHTIANANVTLKDGAVAELALHNPTGGEDILLGNIRNGDSRAATWKASWATEGVKGWSVNARSDNWTDRTAAVNVTVDGTPPGQVGNLGSSTHTPNVWSNDTSITYTWTAAPDNLAGIDGYGIFTSSGAPGTPSTVKDLNAVTSYTESLTTSATGYYFNIRAVDRSGNWGTSANKGPFLIDAVQPDYMTGLQSSSHQVNVLSCNPTIFMTWDPANDAHSGIAGFSYVWDHNPITQPAPSINLFGNVSGASFLLASSALPYYFHITPIDHAGNNQNAFHAGPYFINASPASTYCTAKTNSAGCVPAIAFQNAPSKSAGNFTVSASNLLNNQLGVLFWGTNGQASAPFQGGFLCVAPPVLRTPFANSGGSGGGPNCTGTMAFNWTTAYLNANALNPGQTVSCQFWTRDPGSASGTGLTNAVSFTICQ